MTGEEFAKICFAARPILWAVAIIAVLLVAAHVAPRLRGPTPPKGKSQLPGLANGPF